MYLVEHEPAECHQTLLYNEWRFVHARINSAYIYKLYIYMGRDLRKPGLMTNISIFVFRHFQLTISIMI